MTRERLYATVRGVLVPFGGFIAGWTAYRLAEDKGLMSDDYLRHIRLITLKSQLYLQQHILPATLVEKYGYPNDFLKDAMDQCQSSGKETDTRWSFDQVLKECRVPEQIAWLEEHVSYEIPYFYISDLFNGWCSIHQDSFYTKGENSAFVSPRNKDDFASEVLCRGVVDKTLSGVLPFDVASRTLCILAIGHTGNARLILNLITPNDILKRYETYTEEMKAKGTPAGDTVPADVVAAATMTLLRALNAAAVHRRWVPFWGPPSTGPYPLVSLLDADRWCRCFGHCPSALSARCDQSSLLLAGILSERFDCATKNLKSAISTDE